MMELASTRTAIAFDYGDVRRANIATNHGHAFGTRHQESFVKLEGTRGAAVVRMGVNLDYPRGRPDELEYCVTDGGGTPAWTSVRLEGSWFPDAFVGPMASLMRFASGEATELPTSVEDAWRTMAVIEACYASSDRRRDPHSPHEIQIPKGPPLRHGPPREAREVRGVQALPRGRVARRAGAHHGLQDPQLLDLPQGRLALLLLRVLGRRLRGRHAAHGGGPRDPALVGHHGAHAGSRCRTASRASGGRRMEEVFHHD
jgi:hypothetical protein